MTEGRINNHVCIIKTYFNGKTSINMNNLSLILCVGRLHIHYCLNDQNPQNTFIIILKKTRYFGVLTFCVEYISSQYNCNRHTSK